jgi:hypothetical protein
VEPTREEEQWWYEMDSYLADDPLMFELPGTLRRFLEQDRRSRPERQGSLEVSTNDTCVQLNPNLPAINLGFKIALAVFEGIQEFIDDKAFYPNLAAVIVVSGVKITTEVFDYKQSKRRDCLQEKLITILDSLDEISSQQGSAERLLIEQDLTRTGDSRIGVLQLPEGFSVVVENEEGEMVSVPGKLDRVRAIVRATLEALKDAGQNQRHADAKEFFLRGEYWYEQGEYKEAYTQYREAYRAGVTR